MTAEEYQARWEINFNGIVNMDEIDIWNRTTFPTETSDFYVHISDDPFDGQSLDDILNDPAVTSIYVD